MGKVSLDGMDIPEELSHRQDRIAAIFKAKKEIEQCAKQCYEKEKKAYDKKISEREANAKKTGRKPQGRKLKQPDPGPNKTDQINLTDE